AIIRLVGEQRALRAYELDNDEWDIIKQLTDILKVYKHVTLFFSCTTPSLSTVIPVMDHIDDVLTDFSLDVVQEYAPAIRTACALSKKTLNRYYNKTDYSDNYRISMILDPHYKLEYFKDHDWSEEWIETALQVTRDEFECSYASMELPENWDEMKRLLTKVHLITCCFHHNQCPSFIPPSPPTSFAPIPHCHQSTLT
ncbi:hypothetical protein DFP72DRAFT_801536, partial [Ephemerocybe angulata]